MSDGPNEDTLQDKLAQWAALFSANPVVRFGDSPHRVFLDIEKDLRAAIEALNERA
jgi:hypothetical protein